MKADAIIAWKKSGKLGCPIDRSHCHKFVNWCGLRQSTMIWGSAGRGQTPVVKWIFQLWSSRQAIFQVPYRNENSPTIHHTPVRISSTSMIGHTTSTGSKNTWLKLHESPVEHCPFVPSKTLKTHTEASKLWRIQRVATLWLEMSPMCQVQRHDQHIHYPNFLYDHTRAAWWAAAYVGHGLETADAQAPAARVYELESCPNKYQQHA